MHGVFLCLKALPFSLLNGYFMSLEGVLQFIYIKNQNLINC